MKRLKLYEDFDWTEDDFDFEEEDENENVIPDKEFVKFLKDNHCYNEFIINFENQLESSTGRKFGNIHKETNLKDYIKNTKKYDYIQYPFYWDNTPEGENYWEDLEDRWQVWIE